MDPEGDDTGIWASVTDAELEDATRRVIARLVALASEMDDDERSVLANLLAPAIDALVDEDVTGFGSEATRLPRGIADAIHGSGLRISDRPTG